MEVQIASKGSLRAFIKSETVDAIKAVCFHKNSEQLKLDAAQFPKLLLANVNIDLIPGLLVKDETPVVTFLDKPDSILRCCTVDAFTAAYMEIRLTFERLAKTESNKC